MSPTDERRCLPGDGQQVVHDEQEDCVAEDEGHLEGGSVAFRRQQKAEEVQCDEEAAGDQKVHHVGEWSTSQNDLKKRRRL